jgi:ABC-type transport system involved in multi-copper enzyme maturation permease subunit
MNLALLRNTLQRLLTRPTAAAIILAYALYALAAGTFIQAMGSQPGLMNGPRWDSSALSAWFLTWALGSGLLGSERSAGHLPLLLSRPVSRAAYVLSRWAGLVIAVLCIDGLIMLASLLLLAGKHQAPDLAVIAARFAWFAYFTLLSSAWLTLLSAAFGGHGDLFYFFAASLVAYLAGLSSLGSDGLKKAYEILAWFWAPGHATFDLAKQGQGDSALYGALAFLAAAAASLWLAISILRRRDISYVNR